MVKIHALCKSFRGAEAVSNLTFKVQPGEVLGLIGPKGAGKSTLIKLIAGALRLEMGSVEIGGFDLRTAPVEAKRQLRYLPDHPLFLDNLTCWEQVQFVAGLYSVPDYETKALALFARFQMSDKMEAFPSQLSKGERQRVALICTLLPSPKVLLFDEPLTGLDPRQIQTLNEIIREEAAKGAAILLSSSLLSTLEEVCTKVLILDRGKARLYGTVDDVRRSPERNVSLEEMAVWVHDRFDVSNAS